ncbi:MAG: hypothetical protein SGPRY_011539 [Prymnesium sp.]
MFRQVDKARAGFVSAGQLRTLFQYLNFDLLPEVEAAELRYLSNASSRATSRSFTPRALTPRLTPRESKVHRLVNFREFNQMVQATTGSQAVCPTAIAAVETAASTQLRLGAKGGNDSELLSRAAAESGDPLPPRPAGGSQLFASSSCGSEEGLLKGREVEGLVRWKEREGLVRGRDGEGLVRGREGEGAGKPPIPKHASSKPFGELLASCHEGRFGYDSAKREGGGGRGDDLPAVPAIGLARGSSKCSFPRCGWKKIDLAEVGRVEAPRGGAPSELSYSYRSYGSCGSFNSPRRSQQQKGTGASVVSLIRTQSRSFLGTSKVARSGLWFDERQVVRLLRHPQLQGESEELPPAIMRKFDSLAGKRRKIGVMGLQRLLLSTENELLAPQHRMVDETSLHYPLTDYYIASSHNSYLTGERGRLRGKGRGRMSMIRGGLRLGLARVIVILRVRVRVKPGFGLNLGLISGRCKEYSWLRLKLG